MCLSWWKPTGSPIALEKIQWWRVPYANRHQEMEGFEILHVLLFLLQLADFQALPAKTRKSNSW